MPDWKEANAKLAWGFGTRGRGNEVFEALENPEKYLRQRGYSNRKFMTRANVMKALAEEGAVGFESPYYTSMAFRAVKRFAGEYPGLVDDPSVRLPWMSQGMTTMKEIM